MYRVPAADKEERWVALSDEENGAVRTMKKKNKKKKNSTTVCSNNKKHLTMPTVEMAIMDPESNTTASFASFASAVCFNEVG